MRTSLSLAVAVPTAAARAACLSAPTGLPADGSVVDAAADATVDAALPGWPAASVDIIGIATGLVDTVDAFDDLIAVDASNGGSVYLLRGGVDVRFDRQSVTTYSKHGTFTGMAGSGPLRGPATATITKDTGGAPRVVVFDNPATGGVRITVFDGDLSQTGQAQLASVPAAAMGATISLHPSIFGMNGGSVIGTTPTNVFFLEKGQLSLATPMIVTPLDTGGGRAAMTSIVVADGYVATGPRFLVGQTKLAQRATPMTWTWSTLRDETAAAMKAWTVQVTSSITADTAPDIVGFDPTGGSGGPNPSAVCVLDIEAGPPGVFDCVDTPFMGATMVDIEVGGLVAGGGHDVALLGVGGATADVFLLANLGFVGGNATAGMAMQPGMFTITRPLMALAQLDADATEILLVGGTGQVQCVKATTSPPSKCTP